jgi:hypothetical protein
MAATPAEEPVRQSDFIFNGTVEEVHATTLTALEATDRTAVVRVDEVIRAPAAFTGLTGQLVTVQLREPGGVEAGERAAFFATGLLFGDGIAVEEIERRPAEPGAAALAGEVSDVLARAEDSQILARANAADLVVEGRVADVRPSPAAATADPISPAPPSEHDPQWMEAVLDVRNVLKGEAPTDPTIVLFAASIDVMWFDAPKFHAGQRGVWFLRKDEVPTAAVAQFPSVYTALTPTDFQPSERAERIHDLLRRSGS